MDSIERTHGAHGPNPSLQRALAQPPPPKFLLCRTGAPERPPKTATRHNLLVRFARLRRRSQARRLSIQTSGLSPPLVVGDGEEKRVAEHHSTPSRRYGNVSFATEPNMPATRYAQIARSIQACRVANAPGTASRRW